MDGKVVFVKEKVMEQNSLLASDTLGFAQRSQKTAREAKDATDGSRPSPERFLR